MKQAIVHVALVVDDYDEAIDFYTRVVGFELIEDTYIAEQDKRWVIVAPRNGAGAALLLAKASSDEQKAFVGNQAGGRVFLFLSTDDFWRDFNRLKSQDVEFVREPSQNEYGLAAVFLDLYGNRWDLLEYVREHPFSQKP